ncbi:hypothetical protein CSKR_201279 [Clonorchis sinensis]|uniref:Uncharacterized protein n=1 Tax=Clonorchis sinensis TaxID=79923 RepID=A0A8T1MNP3_CLOSI|nr:hypothetical protein CSKR_201279 [Clonorchis sinensis]
MFKHLVNLTKEVSVFHTTPALPWQTPALRDTANELTGKWYQVLKPSKSGLCESTRAKNVGLGKSYTSLVRMTRTSGGLNWLPKLIANQKASYRRFKNLRKALQVIPTIWTYNSLRLLIPSMKSPLTPPHAHRFDQLQLTMCTRLPDLPKPSAKETVATIATLRQVCGFFQLMAILDGADALCSQPRAPTTSLFTSSICLKDAVVIKLFESRQQLTTNGKPSGNMPLYSLSTSASECLLISLAGSPRNCETSFGTG